MHEAIVFCALLLGGVVHSTAGFGSALVAMPILTLALPATTATPLQNTTGLLLSALIWYRHRARWPWRDSIPLILFSFAGIPLGTYALTHVPQRLVLGALGILLIGFAGFEYATARFGGVAHGQAIRRDPACIGASLAGLLAGLLGAAYATNGPPAIAYGTLRRWPRAEFKAALQSLFFVNGIGIVLWQSSRGLLTPEVGWLALFAVPGLALGATIGYGVDKRLDPDRFRSIVLALLVVLGAVLVVRAWR